MYLQATKGYKVFPITHDDRPATIYVTDDSVYAIYDDTDDGDAFFYTELDDDSVNLAEELTSEFGPETAQDILDEVEANRE